MGIRFDLRRRCLKFGIGIGICSFLLNKADIDPDAYSYIGLIVKGSDFHAYRVCEVLLAVQRQGRTDSNTPLQISTSSPPAILR
jgi:hypothetical protein